jgi:hypothetical protein
MSIADSPIARRALDVGRSAWAVALDLAGQAFEEVREHAPIVGRTAVRRRSGVVLAPYRRTYSLGRSVRNILIVPALVVFCLVYGFFFALTAPSLIVAFVTPLVILAALIIWALPHQRTAPTALIEFLYPCFFVALFLWPNYLAISLPGLPWITLLRIIGLPMASALLISLSVSPPFRRRVGESLKGVPLLWAFMLSFILVQIATTLISAEPGASAQLLFNQSIYWTSVFVIGCVLFRDIRYVEKYWGLLCCLAVPICIITALEFRGQHIMWAAHIPAFLRVPDPSVDIALTPHFRPGTNVYRAPGTSNTPLVLAEYMALLTPFFLHFGFWSKKKILQIASFAMVPVLFITIRMTDCRLGVAGMLVSVLLYGVVWSIVRWRSHPRDLLAAATVYAYPAVFIAGVGAVFASHRLNMMVFGGGAQASSTEARSTQLGMAIHQLMKAPWGHGIGQSGNAMGYGVGQFITIDNYFISIALDYGFLGIFFWYGMFIIAMLQAARYTISSRYAGRPEARLLGPLGVSIAAFLVIKWVHGQDDNHPMLFMMLGMVSALIYRLRNEATEVETANLTEQRPHRASAPRLAPAYRSPSHGFAPRQMTD